MKHKRFLFAAAAGGLDIRICEQLADASLRMMLWSKLTAAERRRGEQFVKRLAPTGAGACEWTSANGPKTEEDAKALEEFVAAMERHHGAGIWRR
jgi:hypothetical protein